MIMMPIYRLSFNLLSVISLITITNAGAIKFDFSINPSKISNVSSQWAKEMEKLVDKVIKSKQPIPFVQSSQMQHEFYDHYPEYPGDDYYSYDELFADYKSYYDEYYGKNKPKLAALPYDRPKHGFIGHDRPRHDFMVHDRPNNLFFGPHKNFHHENNHFAGDEKFHRNQRKNEEANNWSIQSYIDKIKENSFFPTNSTLAAINLPQPDMNFNLSTANYFHNLQEVLAMSLANNSLISNFSLPFQWSELGINESPAKEDPESSNMLTSVFKQCLSNYANELGWNDEDKNAATATSQYIALSTLLSIFNGYSENAPSKANWQHLIEIKNNLFSNVPLENDEIIQISLYCLGDVLRNILATN